MKILSDIIQNIKVLETHGNVDVYVSSVTLHSNDVLNNSIFIATKGSVTDGHMFIDDAISKGASVVVHQDELKEKIKGVTYIKVLDSKEALGLIASNFYDNPSRKLKIIGITGTNGKTTTATLLYELFKKLGHRVGLIGTVVNKINEQIYESIRTTPDAINLNKLLNMMVEDGCKYVFMEVSSHAVSEKRISGMVFSGGVFTNLTLDHLDYHKTFEEYRESKKAFFDSLNENAFAFSNIDDPVGQYMLSKTKASKYFYGLQNTYADFTERLQTKLIGEFNAYNALAIYGVALILGEDKEKVKSIMKELDAVPGRFQYIKSKNNITGIVDYAHTPDALENVLKTINNMKKDAKVISVFGCGGDRDKSKRPIMARIGYDMSDIVILTSDNPRTEKPEDILSDMQKGIPLDGDDKVEIIIDRYMAIQKSCELAKPGDFILVAGKGHENYQEINGVKHHFDDIEELEKCFK